MIWNETKEEYREKTKAIYFLIIYIELRLVLGLEFGFGGK